MQVRAFERYIPLNSELIKKKYKHAINYLYDPL